LKKSENISFLMNKIKEGYSIAIPAYGRPNEYDELLQSILDMNFLPDEIIICEDFSKEREAIKEITNKYRFYFQEKKIIVSYIENEVNLGYDANIRKLITEATYKWVILIGNDDLFLKNGLTEIDSFCKKNTDIAMISRPFVRFKDDINEPIGVSRMFPKETIVDTNVSSKFIFRICGFVGGLVVNKNWAVKFATNKYDGTLYYQIYLGAHAYCTNGIGYLANPSVGGRTGNPPLFGESAKDGNLHIPGAYSAIARATMWKGVLDIGQDVGAKYNINLVEGLKHELEVRQSFHVFEMNVGVSKKELNELKKELQKLNLFNHYLPKALYYLNRVFGKYAYYFYYLTRKIVQ
jgi:glycosyltransferase involved in cell wall biosynthesis